MFRVFSTFPNLDSFHLSIPGNFSQLINQIIVFFLFMLMKILLQMEISEKSTS